MLILGDLRRPEMLDLAATQYERGSLNRALADAPSPEVFVMAAMLQPETLPGLIEKSGDFAHREAAKELRQFASLRARGIVPLLVVYPGGLWATQWASESSGVQVHRYDPRAAVEAN